MSEKTKNPGKELMTFQFDAHLLVKAGGNEAYEGQWKVREIKFGGRHFKALSGDGTAVEFRDCVTLSDALRGI